MAEKELKLYCDNPQCDKQITEGRVMYENNLGEVYHSNGMSDFGYCT